jgi:hypothetical protein
MARCGEIVRPYQSCVLGIVLAALIAVVSGRAAGADVVIAGGTSSGLPGTAVSFAVQLQTGGLTVGSTQNDLTFDPAHTPIRALSSGDPDCTVNPAISTPIGNFTFEPPGCSGAACTAVGAIVFSLLTPIPDGVLYTCTVDIAAGTPSGTYPMLVGNAAASSLIGDSLPTSGSDGQVVVTATAPIPVIPSPTSPAGLAMIGLLGVAMARRLLRKGRRSTQRTIRGRGPS